MALPLSVFSVELVMRAIDALSTQIQSRPCSELVVSIKPSAKRNRLTSRQTQLDAAVTSLIKDALAGVPSDKSVLVVDVGGTSVKILASTQSEIRSFLSGPRLTPRQMVLGVKKHLLPSSPVLPKRRSVEVPTSDRHLLLTGRTAMGFCRVSWIFSVSWRIIRHSPSRSAYCAFSRPISISSL